MSRTYWRSLAELDKSPESRAFLEREFPEGASELPEGITRRDMITLLGASISIAGLAGCDIIRRPVENIVPYVNAPEDIVPGIPRYYATTMPFRRSAYGVIVESHEGRPTKIEGNPSHPSTLGASSSRVQASVLGLYDPDRSQTVRLKGEAKSWADFVAAWGELAKAHAADGGAGLAFLSESYSSPTLARLAAELRARYPKLRWATYDAVSDENRLAGLKQATGRDVDLQLRFDRASVILTLDADPLLTDAEMIRHARGFADGRRAGASGGVMNRLYAVEGVYSLTGAMADHRLRLESRQIAPFLAALATRLAAPGATAGAGVAGVEPRWIDALAKDLLANRGKGLIVAGDRQPAAVHAAVCALNTHLGNTGSTVSYYETKDTSLPSAGSLSSLVSAMQGGSIQTLVVLGGNPVFDAPADLDFAAAMAKVPHSIAMGHTVDETSSKAEWHIPHAHYLESWGDARAVGGTLSVVQPLILPLFGGRTAVEVLGMMIVDKDCPGYEIVRDTWKPILGEAEFDKRNRVLHDGLLAGSELTEIAHAAKADAFAGLGASGSASGLEIGVPPVAVDSRRPLRQRRVAAGTSGSAYQADLGQPGAREPEDRRNARSCERGCGSRRVFGPLARAPRVAPARYGGRRRRLDARLRPYARGPDSGTGVGFDAFKVRTSKAPGFDSGVTLSKVARAYPLSATRGTREHGRAPPRARVDARRASSEGRPGGEAGCRRGARGRVTRGRAVRRKSSPRRARRLRRKARALLPLE